MRVVEKRAMSATHKSFRHRSQSIGGTYFSVNSETILNNICMRHVLNIIGTLSVWKQTKTIFIYCCNTIQQIQ